MAQMGNAALNQAVDIGKDKLRDFLENNDRAKAALGVSGRSNGHGNGTGISMDRLDSKGKKTQQEEDDDDF